MNSLKKSNNLELDIINSSFEEQLKELSELDNLFEHKFQSRCDITPDQEKKIINKAKLNFYSHNFEFEEDNKQKQINKLLSLIGKNCKKYSSNNIFKPLLKPKIISMKNKVFYNGNNNKIIDNIKLNENNNANNAIKNSIKLSI